MKWGSHRNSGSLSGKLAATKSHTWQQCPSLWPPRQHPCPYPGPCPCPAQPGFKRPWAQEPVNPDTGCAHPGAQFLSGLSSSGSNHPTPNRAPAACCPANFSALFLFAGPQNGASHRQALQELSANPRPVVLRQIPAARRPPDPDPPRANGARAAACRLGPDHSLPSRRALTDLCQAQLHEAESPRCAPPKRVHGVGATDRASGVEPEGPGAGRGPAEHGASRAPEPVGGWGPAGNEGASEVGCSFYSRVERVT